MSSENVNQTYLITGVNRGIGHAFLRSFLPRPDTTVIATVRAPTDPTVAAAMASVPVGSGSRLIVMELASTAEHGARDMVAELRRRYGVLRVDVVVANAGIGRGYGAVREVDVKEVWEHVGVNGIGPFLLFQAVLPLLEAAPQPKFVLVGSMYGSIGGMEKYPFPLFAYGASKAMAHYLVRKIHCEHENICSFAVDPGFTQTDTGNAGAKFFGMEEAPVKVEDSRKFIVEQIDGATREKTSGRFPALAGGETEW